MFIWIVLFCAVLGSVFRIAEDHFDRPKSRDRNRDINREDREFMEWIMEEADDDEY